jgi:ankyrin repeat protein
VDIEARDMNMSTPLIMAAHKKNVDMMHVLLKYGAKTEAADDSGWTGLRALVLQK